MKELSKTELAALKEKHGTLYLIEIESGESAIFRQVRERDLSKANKLGGSDALKIQKILLQELFVHGDEAIKTDEELRMAAYPKLDELIKVKEATIKKL